jgi:hypothetical protein
MRPGSSMGQIQGASTSERTDRPGWHRRRTRGNITAATEPGLNKPIHIVGSAVVLLVLLVPALERRLKAWLWGEDRPWKQ